MQNVIRWQSKNRVLLNNLKEYQKPLKPLVLGLTVVQCCYLAKRLFMKEAFLRWKSSLPPITHPSTCYFHFTFVGVSLVMVVFLIAMASNPPGMASNLRANYIRPFFLLSF